MISTCATCGLNQDSDDLRTQFNHCQGCPESPQYQFQRRMALLQAAAVLRNRHISNTTLVWAVSEAQQLLELIEKSK